MDKMGLVESALCYAARKHSGQFRKGSNMPYILHPMECAQIVSEMTDSPAVIAAAILHDVLEDTSATEAELLELFGPEITELVRTESEDKRPGVPRAESWKTRKQETLARLEGESRSAMMITLGDKLSNLRAIKRDLAVMGEDLWQRFNQKNAAEHAWYYRSVARCLSPLAAYPAYREYCVLLREVFGEK